MASSLSARLLGIVVALPLRPGLRVIEIGCGPGAMAREMAREMARRVGHGHVLGIDRSARAIARAEAGGRDAIAAGRLSFRRVAVEAFAPAPHESPFDLAVAVQVGALDGRHPAIEALARRRIAAALAPGGRLFIDGGDPLLEIRLDP